MRVRIGDKPRGLVLVLTMMTVFIAGFILTSYIALVVQVNAAVERSQSWNDAIPVLESGIEEALTQLYCAGTNSSLLSSNGWNPGGDGLYHKTRSFSDGSYFNASIQAAGHPVIMSTGFVAVVYRSGATTNYINRQVKVVTQRKPPTPGGLNAKGTINMTGVSCFDSFDSSDPSHSSNGLYVASLRKSNGLALTDSGAGGAVSLGGSTLIYGSVATGPSGTVSLGSNAAVGDAAWDASHSGIEPGHSVNDANVQFNDVAAPFSYGSASTPSSGAYTYGGTNYSYLLGSGSYNMLSLSLGGHDSMAITGNCTLYVNGSVSVSSQAYIYIAPGAALSLYLNGDASLGGGGVVNGAQTASYCAVYGLPGCTSLTYAGNASLVATVYAPDAAFSVSGSADVSGSITASAISLVGGAGFHYDEELSYAGSGNYVVMSWNEI